ncbi:MAG: 23S rRNA (guanosine(2251)-2'-O)-methyltransferase RlmB [Firmicutes bacterium]|nr:23S rRNA (guanosine(2251)-2'-O)-methyltransferase RlmB [Bacillota bacterium]
MNYEGKNAVAEAMDAQNPPEKILIDKRTTDTAFVNKIKTSGIMYQFVDRAALDRVSKTRNHQGFIAITSEFEYTDIDEIIKKSDEQNAIILVLDGVEDPHNLGNIIRTAECMGVAGIIIPKNRATGVTETTIRVSAGATTHMRVARVTNIGQAIEKLKENRFWIFAAEAGGSSITKSNLTGRTAIVMGGEGSGVRTLTKKLSDGIISIPMHGKLNSLNVASATAMVLYEVRRQIKG